MQREVKEDNKMEVRGVVDLDFGGKGYGSWLLTIGEGYSGVNSIYQQHGAEIKDVADMIKEREIFPTPRTLGMTIASMERIVNISKHGPRYEWFKKEFSKPNSENNGAHLTAEELEYLPYALLMVHLVGKFNNIQSHTLLCQRGGMGFLCYGARELFKVLAPLDIKEDFGKEEHPKFGFAWLDMQHIMSGYGVKLPMSDKLKKYAIENPEVV